MLIMLNRFMQHPETKEELALPFAVRTEAIISLTELPAQPGSEARCVLQLDAGDFDGGGTVLVLGSASGLLTRFRAEREQEEQTRLEAIAQAMARIYPPFDPGGDDEPSPTSPL